MDLDNVKHSSSALTSAIQQRHLDAISDFQSEVRSMSASIDTDTFTILADLRTKLMTSRSLAEDLLTQEGERIASHKQFLTERSMQFEEREPGAEVRPFADCIHQDGEIKSLVTRRIKIANRCREVLELGSKLRIAHDHRMGLISNAEDFLKAGEVKRKGTVQSEIESLLTKLTTIAYTDVTGSQLLVQRAAISVNEQLHQNQMATSRLISQLKQHELLKQRDYNKIVADLYQRVQQVIASSLILWTHEYLSSPLFRAPVSRTQLILRIGKFCAATRRELSHAVEGVARLTESLEKKRNDALLEQPGGTIKDGLLRTYDDTDPQPFPESPVIVAEETKVAIEVILHHAQCSNSMFLTDCEKLNSELLAKVDDTIESLLEDIVSCFSPKDEEAEIIREIALEKEEVFPLNVIVRDENCIKTSSDLVKESCAPIRSQIQAECQWYIEGLAWNLCQQNIKLMAKFITGSGSVIGVLWDSTIRLEQIATQVAILVRTFWVQQDSLQNDYEDRLRTVEESYDKTEFELMHAGSVDGATLLCDHAMKLLEEIEALHCENHIRRTDLMSPAQEVLAETTQRLSLDLQEALGVRALEEIERYNEEVEHEAEQREAQRIAAGTKKDLLKAFNALPPLREKIEVDEARCITMSDGVTYLVSPGQMEVGFKPEVKEEPKKSPEVPSGKETKKEEKQKEKKKVQPTSVPEETQEQLPRPVTPSGKAFEIFKLKNQNVFSDLFHPEVLVVESQLQACFQRIRAALLNWCNTFRKNALLSVSTYCKVTKEALDERSNHLIRHHQRRAPTLQSQIYDLRVRELEENSKGRLKYVAWLHQRLSQAQGNAFSAIEASNRVVDGDIQDLQSMRKSLIGIMSGSALDTHKRSFLQKKERALIHSQHSADQITKQVDHALHNINGEIQKYYNERLKSFDQGGSLSPDELEQMKKQLADIELEATETKAKVQRAVDEAGAQQQRQLTVELDSYNEAHAVNVEELKFFAQMQEQFAAAKAKITNQISNSKQAEQSVDAVLSELEQLVGSKTTHKRSVLNAAHSLDVDYEASGLIHDSRFDADSSNGWQGDDEIISHQFRTCRLQSENLSRSSKTLKLLTVLDELRKQLYLRGLSLGCLQYGVDYQLIPPDGFLEMKRDATGGAQPAPVVGGKEGKDTKKPAPKPAKGEKGGKGSPADENSKPDDLSFLKITRLELQAQRWLAPMTEQLQSTATSYFVQHPPPLLRESVLGADMSAVGATIQRRTGEQENRVTNHVTTAVGVYREQVQRAHLAIHRFSTELFVNLTNLSADSIDLRLCDLFAVFNTFETSILQSKRKNNSVVKASMAAPTNRHKLDKLALFESERQRRNLELLKKYVGVVSREVQLEATSHASKAAHVLAVFYTIARGFVTPEHLVPGEEVVVGRHKGLKRLMRQRMKEELARGLEGATVEKDGTGKGKEKKDLKKTEAKKKEEKNKGKNKAGDAHREEEEPPLPVLEKPNQEIPGVILNSIKSYEEFKMKTPGFEIKNHHLTPAQWAEEAARLHADQQAAQEVATSKKPAPKAKQAKSQEKQAPPPEGSSTELSSPSYSQALTAPKEKIYQQALLARQTSIEGFNSMCTQFLEKVEKRLHGLESVEHAWVKSWDDAVSVLRQSQQPTNQK